MDSSDGVSFSLESLEIKRYFWTSSASWSIATWNLIHSTSNGETTRRTFGYDGYWGWQEGLILLALAWKAGCFQRTPPPFLKKEITWSDLLAKFSSHWFSYDS